MKHENGHEETLAQCLAERSPRRALSASAAAGCAECAALLEEMLQARDGLDALARDRRSAFEGEQAPAFGEHLVERVLRPRLAARVRSRLLARAAAWLAAAGLLLLALVLWRERRPSSGNGPHLGPGGLELLTPLGEVSAWGVFRWQGERPPEGWYELRVRAPDGRELRHEILEESRWTPVSTDAWPSEILWRVELFDASGARRAGREGRASLSSR